MVVNKELRAQIAVLTKKVSLSSTIDEILLEERIKRKMLEKELEALKSKVSNPTLQETIAKAQKALDVTHKALGANHPAMIPNYINIASLYYQAKKYPKAKETIQKALEIAQESLPENHPHRTLAEKLLEKIKEKL